MPFGTYSVGHKPGDPQALSENTNLCNDHLSIEGSLVFNCDECHAHSMRGSVVGLVSRHAVVHLSRNSQGAPL